MSNSKPEIKIKGKVQNMEKKEKNVKPKVSNFLLTINTNQQYKPEDEHLSDDIEVFEKSIVNILENIQNYVNLPDGVTWDDQTIKDIDIDYTIEKGMKRGQLHIHILFKFVHFTRIQLNYAKIKEKINTDLGLENVYMYNRLVKNSGQQNILAYLEKYT
jgi:hypothetical protein